MKPLHCRKTTPRRRQTCPSQHSRGTGKHPGAHTGTGTAHTPPHTHGERQAPAPRHRARGIGTHRAAHTRTGSTGAHGYSTHTHTHSSHSHPCRGGRRGAGCAPAPRTHRQHRSHRRTRAPAAHIQVAAAWLPHRHVVSPPPVSSGEEKQTGSIPSFHSCGQRRELSPLPGQPVSAAASSWPCTFAVSPHWHTGHRLPTLTLTLRSLGAFPTPCTRGAVQAPVLQKLRDILGYLTAVSNCSKFTSPKKHVAIGKRKPCIRPALSCSEPSPWVDAALGAQTGT